MAIEGSITSSKRLQLHCMQADRRYGHGAIDACMQIVQRLPSSTQPPRPAECAGAGAGCSALSATHLLALADPCSLTFQAGNGALGIWSTPSGVRSATTRPRKVLINGGAPGGCGRPRALPTGSKNRPGGQRPFDRSNEANGVYWVVCPQPAAVCVLTAR